MATDDDKRDTPKLRVKRKRRRLYEMVPEAETAAAETAVPEPAKTVKRPKRTRKQPAKATALARVESRPPARRAAAPVRDALAERTKSAEKLVRKYSLGTAAVGIVPLPLVDLVAFSLLQGKMLKSLTALYGIEYSEQRAKIFIAAAVGSVTSVSVAGQACRLIASLLKRLHPVGLVVGGALMPATTAASTYALGKVFIQHFECGGTLLDFDPEKTRGYYEKLYAEAQAPA